MKITLDANPDDAPCCIKIIAENGEDRLIQTDWDYPGIASAFGWSPVLVETGPEGWHFRPTPCQHLNTDGTVDCPACKQTASAFIAHARQWIDNHDGETVEDPGYFEN